ncbi:MAG: hypothetical protein M3203_16015 [Actinomycetota bacterium]|nr:hypothetical protein [Actinomycetota bacterium]
MWIAAVDALVVLALGATVLLIAIFYGFADEHASIADRGYPVVAPVVGVWSPSSSPRLPQGSCSGGSSRTHVRHQ